MVTEVETNLVKATLTSLESLQTVTVLWNPSRYRLRRRSHLAVPRVLGQSAADALRVCGGEERFETRLFLDTTDQSPGETRNARRIADVLSSWMQPPDGEIRPPRVAFIWGPFRFDGAIELLEEEWIRFDPDGTPVRAWLTLALRK